MGMPGKNVPEREMRESWQKSLGLLKHNLMDGNVFRGQRMNHLTFPSRPRQSSSLSALPGNRVGRSPLRDPFPPAVNILAGIRDIHATLQIHYPSKPLFLANSFLKLFVVQNSRSPSCYPNAEDTIPLLTLPPQPANSSTPAGLPTDQPSWPHHPGRFLARISPIFVGVPGYTAVPFLFFDIPRQFFPLKKKWDGGGGIHLSAFG